MEIEILTYARSTRPVTMVKYVMILSYITGKYALSS